MQRAHLWCPMQQECLRPKEMRRSLPSVIILPVLAFDATGARLGRGGGHYDRTLAGLRKKCHLRAIGLAFDEQMVEKCPVEPHDAPLDMVVTPMRVIRCGEGKRS